MTNSGSSPDSNKKGFRVTVMQGVIGAVSLAGTTAIPLVVNKYLGPSTPAASPSPTVASPSPAVASPSPSPISSPPVVPAQVASPVQPTLQPAIDTVNLQDYDDGHGKPKGKKKGKKDD